MLASPLRHSLHCFKYVAMKNGLSTSVLTDNPIRSAKSSYLCDSPYLSALPHKLASFSNWLTFGSHAHLPLSRYPICPIFAFHKTDNIRNDYLLEFRLRNHAYGCTTSCTHHPQHRFSRSNIFYQSSSRTPLRWLRLANATFASVIDMRHAVDQSLFPLPLRGMRGQAGGFGCVVR